MMNSLADKDRHYIWHPFTQMKEWIEEEPLIIESGEGAILRDVHGNEYIDANSSIWTILHGHNHPKINRAIRRQLGKIAHSSALGLANEPASLLAEKLVKAANPPMVAQASSLRVRVTFQSPETELGSSSTSRQECLLYNKEGRDESRPLVF